MYSTNRQIGLKCGRVLCVQCNTVIFCRVCDVRSARKFYFGLVTNEARNKWRPVDRRPYSDRVSCFRRGTHICFPPTVVPRSKLPYPSYAGQLHPSEYVTLSTPRSSARSSSTTFTTKLCTDFSFSIHAIYLKQLASPPLFLSPR
jgi:hypothetical protein